MSRRLITTVYLNHFAMWATSVLLFLGLTAGVAPTYAMSHPKHISLPATIGSNTSSSAWKTLNHPEIHVKDHKSFSITTPPATDLWRPNAEPKSDNFTVPYVYREIKANKFTSIAVTVNADWKTRYDQGGIAIISPGPKPLKWVKTGIEVENGALQYGTVGTYAFSDWSLSPIQPQNATTARFVVERSGSEMWVYVLNDAKMREVTWAFLEDRAGDDVVLQIGGYAGKPTYSANISTEGLEVHFSDLVIV
ncbi:hypothetical protein D6D02_06570 [Aureobasidium pullulans]|nr:hypothetical protein D6D02_06570 [Aureobasidium pullulans]